MNADDAMNPVTYRETNWMGCPLCLSTDITGGSIDIDGKYAYQEIQCDECDATWIEEYVAHRRFDIEGGESNELGL
jgi:hypothetical protein